MTTPTPEGLATVDTWLARNAARARAANALRPALHTPHDAPADAPHVERAIVAIREHARRAPNPLRPRGA